MLPVTDELLTDMVNTIVHEVDPERIYLFGSHARDEATKHSDVDLLVVEKVEKDCFEETIRIRRCLRKFRVPKDILVFSEGEVERWSKARNHIVSTVLGEGRLLYERP